MAAEVTLEQLQGMAKEVYADSFEDLIPEHVYLLKMIPFKESEKLGFAYNEPVVVSESQGVTYGGPEDDAMTLNPPIATSTRNARVRGSQIVARDQIGYKAAASLVAKGPKAFVNGTEHVIRQLLKTSTRRLELMLLYGGSGLGVAASSANQAATKTRITIQTKQWGPGIWVGMKNAQLDAIDNTDAVINTTGPLTVDKVDMANRKLDLTGAAADIAALDTEIAANPNTVRLFFLGAFEKEALGLDKIITTSGTLFEIDNTVYDLFQGNQFDAGGAALSFTKLSKAAGQLVPFGVEGDLLVMVSPATWENLNNDEAGSRRYDSSYKSRLAEKGVEAIDYHYQMGVMSVMSHPCVKEGEAFMVKKSALKRVGAQEISMKNPGSGDRIFFDRPENSSFEIRTYCDQAIFSDHPSWLLKIINIVNS